MKIDIFTHIMPKRYKDAVLRLGTLSASDMNSVIGTPMVYDLDERFRFMDLYEGLSQVLTVASPPLEKIAGPPESIDLARRANDELAELVASHPERFAAGVAALPLSDTDAALEETDRAIRELKLKGIQLFTPVCDRPLDLPEFEPLFKKMAAYDLPIWLHPTRGDDYPDYRSEQRSMHGINGIFGWPYETTVAMTRLVFSGLFERYPNLKIITHHCGAMVPFFADRFDAMNRKMEQNRGRDPRITRPAVEYFKKFYNDTALYGGSAALACGYAFFGPERLLFGTDMPLGDSRRGWLNTGRTIEAIEGMAIPPDEKVMIFETNARRLLG